MTTEFLSQRCKQLEEYILENALPENIDFTMYGSAHYQVKFHDGKPVITVIPWNEFYKEPEMPAKEPITPVSVICFIVVIMVILSLIYFALTVE